MDLIDWLKIPPTARRHLLLIYYLIQVLFILIYAEAEVQAFVYVRF